MDESNIADVGGSSAVIPTPLESSKKPKIAAVRVVGAPSFSNIAPRQPTKDEKNATRAQTVSIDDAELCIEEVKMATGEAEGSSECGVQSTELECMELVFLPMKIRPTVPTITAESMTQA